MARNERRYFIGEIYFMNFSGSGSEQHGWRPGLVIQNNKGNEHSPNLIVLPLTSAIKKVKQPTHVVREAEPTGLRLDSMVLCENPQRMAKRNIGDYITKLSCSDMERVAVAYLLSSSALSFVNPDVLMDVYNQAVELNEVSA